MRKALVLEIDLRVMCHKVGHILGSSAEVDDAGDRTEVHPQPRGLVLVVDILDCSVPWKYTVATRSVLLDENEKGRVDQ